MEEPTLEIDGLYGVVTVERLQAFVDEVKANGNTTVRVQANQYQDDTFRSFELIAEP